VSPNRLLKYHKMGHVLFHIIIHISVSMWHYRTYAVKSELLSKLLRIFL
jgi:hypothetical protein